MHHNELKRGKKTILAGQCTVCSKAKNQFFLDFCTIFQFLFIKAESEVPGVI